MRVRVPPSAPICNRKENRTKLAGYNLVYMPSHDRAFKSGGSKGYVYEHILVAERMLGRSLDHGEVVHHLDANRSNNNESNLIVFDSHSSHASFHTDENKMRLIRNEDGSYHCESKTMCKCEVCGARAMDGRHICFECFKAARRSINTPPLPDLLKDIQTMPYVAIGKKYKVSDNAVRKWLKTYGVSKDIQRLIRASSKRASTK